MGSVKDLHVVEQPTTARPGIGRFIFSDRYSVFDWGAMPDAIAEKGRALCLLGAYFFEKLEEMGHATHYRGVVENDTVKRLDDLRAPSNVMEVDLLRVLRPPLSGSRYDYGIYAKERENFLIPLEVIYRNSLPEGSSVFRRLAEGAVTPEQLGLPREPAPGQRLDPPILDVSTKLEATDRYMTWEEARDISGMRPDEIEEVRRVTLAVDRLISREAAKASLVNEDGKCEFGFGAGRRLMLVDVLGTPDECRFTYDGMPVSKEIARRFYKTTAWYRQATAAKSADRFNWKGRVTAPPRLPSDLANLLSEVYRACCNDITGRTWFDVRPLDEVLADIAETPPFE